MNVIHYRKFLKKIDWNKIAVVGVIAIITAILSLLHVIIGWAKTPTGLQYMWTGHYYLDYFYYLQFIAQGTFGNLIAHQYFATGDNSLYVHLYPYLFIGYFAKLLHISVITAYWSSISVSICIIVFLMYAIIKKILIKESFVIHIYALLFAIYSAPFFTILNIDGLRQIGLYDFWSSESTLFNRFEPIPHHLLSTIGMLASILLIEKIYSAQSKFLLSKNIFKILLLICISSILMVFYPFGMIVFLLGFGLFYIAQTVPLIRAKQYGEAWYVTIIFVTVSTMCIFSGFAIKQYYLRSTTFSENFTSTEILFTQHIPISIFIRMLGPIMIFVPFGIASAFKKRNLMSTFFVFFTSGSIVLFYSPLNNFLGTHNARFLSPLNYITLASVSMYGILSLSHLSRKHTKKLFYSILLVVLLISTISTTQAFTRLLSDKNIDSPLSYLPKTVLAGFAFLNSQSDSKAVLTTPSQFLGQVLPIFVNKKVYIARQIATPDYDMKASQSDAIFRASTPRIEALKFLEKNNIGYVVLTTMEGYVQSNDFRTFDFTTNIYKIYPFLKEIYKNKDIVVMQVKSH